MEDEILSLLRENNAMLKELVSYIRSLQDSENIAKDDMKDLTMNIIANVIADDFIKNEEKMVESIRNRFVRRK